VLHASDQNCRVLGPRSTVARVTFPFATISFNFSYEHPGPKGCFSLRTCQGPIWFCVAWRESGSNKPRHRSHCSAIGWINPQ
jgi:nitrous oxide reductase accessory protein NosL